MKIVLLDFSNIAHSNFHIAKADKNISKNIDPFCTERVKYWKYMTLNSIKKIITKHKPEELVICCDSSSWRKKFFKYYKANREALREKADFDYKIFYENMNQFIDDIENHFPYKIMKVNYAEGDDLLAILAHELSNENEIVVCSSDKDMVQLMNLKNTKVWNIMKWDWNGIPNPDKFLIELILQGDRTDGIPNLLSDDDVFIAEGKRQKPCGPVKISKILEQGLDEFLSENNLEMNYRRNKKLIQLDRSTIPQKLWDYVVQQYNKSENKKFDTIKVLQYIRKNNFKTLEGNVDHFRIQKKSTDINSMFG